MLSVVGWRLKALEKPLAVALVIAAVLIVASLRGPIAPAAKTQLCTLSSSSQCVFTFNLTIGDKVSGSLAFDGASPVGTNLWITDPSGVTIFKGDKVSNAPSFVFITSTKGAYVLHCDGDPAPSTSAQVTLSYYVIALIDC